MKVTGFSFIRNAVKYDYPIKEAILSILPICDDFVVAVGDSEDTTLELIKNIDNKKIKILETVWNDNLREGGQVLALETDKAFQAIDIESDWAFYIQGDEVIHEKYLQEIYTVMKKWKDVEEVDGLLFNYLHFYGSYDYVATSFNWYNEEIRVIKNNKKIYSYKDAQGFRKNDNEKLNVIPLDACVYHYGWVKKPDAMQKKQENFNKYWHNDAWLEENIAKAEHFDYSAIDELALFEDSHPKVILDRIRQKNWGFDYDLSKNRTSFKNRLKKILLKVGINPTYYKNYKILKKLLREH